MLSLALSQFIKSERATASRQTGVLHAAQLMGTGLNFATTTLLAYWLNPDGFSLYTFASTSILTFVSLFFEFGMFSAGSRLLAISRDEREERETLGALVVAGVLLGIAMAVFVGAVAPVIDHVFRAEVRHMLWLCLPLVILIPLQFLLDSACQGNNRISSLAMFRIVLPGFSFLCVAALFAANRLNPLSALVAANLGSAAACLLTISRLHPSFYNVRHHLGRIWEETRRFGFNVYIGRITAVASQKLDGLLIPYFLGYAPLGFYTIGKSLADALIINFSRALAMTRFRAFARSNEVSRTILLANLGLLVLVGGGILVVGPLLLKLFLPKYLAAAGLLLPFVVGSILGGLLQPYNLFLAAHGRGGELRNISMFIGVVYCVALLLVVPWFGLTGAAWVIAAVAGVNLWLHRHHYHEIQNMRVAAGDIPLRFIIVNLSGDKAAAERWAASCAPQVEVRMLDKSSLREDSKKNWIRRLRGQPCDVFAVFCDRLEWQTLRTPMLIFGLLCGAKKCLIVDAHGKTLERSAFAVATWEVFHLGLELVGSVFLIGISWLLTSLLDFERKMKQFREPKTPKKGSGFRVQGSEKKTKNPIDSPDSPDAQACRLLFIRTTPTSGSQTGGATSHISGFISGAVALGNHVRFLSNDAISGVHHEITPVNIIPPSGFFTAHRMLFELWNNLVFTLQAVDEVREQRPDYLYQRYSRFNWTGVALSLRTGIPLLLEYNGSEVWIGKYWDDVQLLWLLEAFEMLNLNAAAAIFVVSEVERQNLLKRGIPDEKIHVNPNGVNPEVFHPNCGGEAVRANLGLENRTIIGFVGTFGPWHGVEVIANAAALLPPDSPLFFVLIGEGAVKGKVEAMVEENGTKDRFLFAGRITHHRVASYLDACDILVSPQVQPEDGGEFFGSPTKLFEYMAMEKAIVASRVGQIGQILEDGKTALLTPPGDAQALANAFQRLATNPELRNDLGRAARHVATETFTWKHNAQRVLEVASRFS